MLAAETIAFTPDLPAWKRQAIDDISMGLLVKIPLQFDGARLGFSANDWLTYKAPEELPAEVCYFLTWPFDFDLMIGFSGGDFGWELSRGDPAAAIDFALGEVVKMVGSEARKAFIKGSVTQWANDPLTLGAYSAARPGRYASRADLKTPLGERVFFAGEAVAGAYVATVGGALLSGRSTALDVAAVLG